jgi:hypothetical protein
MQVKKIKLEEIQVESYVAAAVDGERGTVNAYEDEMATGFVKCYTIWGPTCTTVTSNCNNCE